MIKLKPDFSDLDKYVKAKAEGLSDIRKSSDLSEAYANAGSEYLRVMRNRFSSNSEGNGVWKDLARSTKRKRFSQYGTPAKYVGRVGKRVISYASMKFPILKVTGKLFNSLVPGTDGNIFSLRKNGVEVGTSVPYASYHQYGGPVLPKRTILVKASKNALTDMKRVLVAGFAKFFSNGNST